MYIYVTEKIFMNTYRNAGRKNIYTDEGLKAMYDYLRENEGGNESQDPKKRVVGGELDVVAVDCCYKEYASIEDYNDQNETDYEDVEEIEDSFTIIHVQEREGHFIVGK